MHFQPRRILLPVDFSPPCALAAGVAVDLARTFDATLVALHVWAPATIAVLDAVVIPDAAEVAAQTDRLHEDLRAFVHRLELPADRLERRLVVGVPWRTIVDVASSDRCEAIVMGTHGRTGLAHIALGSVAEHVVRAARVPVVVVPR